jgi:hypothetical protein
MTYLTFTIQLSFITAIIITATPLTPGTTEEQHAVIYFLWTDYQCSMMTVFCRSEAYINATFSFK